MFQKNGVFFTILTTLVVLHGGMAQAAEPKAPDKVPLDDAVVAALRNIEGIVVVPVSPRSDPKIKAIEVGAKGHVDTYPVAGEGKPQGKEAGKAFANALLDTNTCSKWMPFGSEFEPRASFRLSKEKVSLDALPSFKSGYMRVQYRVENKGVIVGNSMNLENRADVLVAHFRLRTVPGDLFPVQTGAVKQRSNGGFCLYMRAITPSAWGGVQGTSERLGAAALTNQFGRHTVFGREIWNASISHPPPTRGHELQCPRASFSATWLSSS